MNKVRTTFLLYCFWMAYIAQAQEKQPPTSYEPSPRFVKSGSTFVPAKKENEAKDTKKLKKSKKNDFNWQLDQQIVAYEQRMKAASKRRMKQEKLSKKSQYSDPSYFGHKKKPKKRAVGKRKLCHECKIVH